MRQKIDKVSLFAVVVDFSEPYVSNNGGYKMKMKLIDESYNRMSSSFGTGMMHFVVHVHFY